MVASLHKHRKTKVTDLLEIESVLNAPIALLFVFLTLGAIGNLVVSESIAAEYLSQVYGMLRQLVTGIGLGIICGMLLFRLMQKYYKKYLSEAILLAAMLFTYLLSEKLNGSGIIAVLALGIFFGNLYVKKKLELIRFNSSFAHSLLIVVSIFIGLSIQPFHDVSFVIKSLALFIVFIAVRLIAIYVSSMQMNFSHEEKLYMALAPKGMIAAATIFCLMSYVFHGSGMIAGLGFTLLPEALMILDLSVLLLIYSLIVSSAMHYLSAK
jgi:cell volume regulation protein A